MSFFRSKLTVLNLIPIEQRCNNNNLQMSKTFKTRLLELEIFFRMLIIDVALSKRKNPIHQREKEITICWTIWNSLASYNLPKKEATLLRERSTDLQYNVIAKIDVTEYIYPISRMQRTSPENRNNHTFTLFIQTLV